MKKNSIVQGIRCPLGLNREFSKQKCKAETVPPLYEGACSKSCHWDFSWEGLNMAMNSSQENCLIDNHREQSKDCRTCERWEGD